MITGNFAIGAGRFVPHSAVYCAAGDGKSAVVVISDDADLADHLQSQKPVRGNRFLLLWVRPRHLGLSRVSHHDSGSVMGAALPGKSKDGAAWFMHRPQKSFVRTNKADIANQEPIEGKFTGSIEASLPNARGTSFQRQLAPFYGTFKAVHCAALAACAPSNPPVHGLRGLFASSLSGAWTESFCKNLRHWQNASGGAGA